MDQGIQENTRMVRSKERASMNGQMEATMMENGLIIKFMDLDDIVGAMVAVI